MLATVEVEEFRPAYVSEWQNSGRAIAVLRRTRSLIRETLSTVAICATAPGRSPTTRSAGGDRFPWRRGSRPRLGPSGRPPLGSDDLGRRLAGPWAYLALSAAVVLGLVVYFFRNPFRHVPQGAGLLVSPADGTIAEITQLPHDDFVGGPAVRVGIFLSIFNVHLNRSPVAARVIALRYSPGEFLNALRPESALRNENMWIALEEESPPHRRLVVRQISGAIARRIVCDLRPGEVVPRGHVFGMIKLGSRTELILPAEEGLEVKVRVGQKVKAGATVVAEYKKLEVRS